MRSASKYETKGKEENEDAKKDDAITSEVVIITCTTPLIGKYVTITVTNEQKYKYHIAELEIYGLITGG